MTAALLILLVMVAVGALLNPSREQFAWFIRLRRPAWLTFEGLIPVIWIAIYACFYASALLAWRASWSWGLMAGYLGLLGVGRGAGGGAAAPIAISSAAADPLSALEPGGHAGDLADAAAQPLRQ